jgi:hypothetical protein
MASTESLIEFSPSESVLKLIKEPAEHDPFGFGYSEYIIEMSRVFGWDVVANVRDEMWLSPPGKSGQVMAPSVLTQLADDPYTDVRLEGSWFTIRPSALHRLQQVDREALEALIVDSKGATPSLDRLARFATTSPDEDAIGSIDPHISSFVNISTGEHDWDWLLWFDALPARVKEIAFHGGTVSVFELGEVAARRLESIACASSYADLTVTDEEFFFGHDPVSEPTEALPNGMPPWAKVTFTPSKGFAAMTAPKRPGAFPDVAYGMWLFALSARQDEGGPTPILDPFWIGDEIEIEVTVDLSDDLTLVGTLRDQRVEKSGKTYTLESAPKAFKDALQKAIQEWDGG